MRRRVRTAARVGVLAALAVLLTGCIKLNMNLGINPDDTVSGTVQFGVQKELLELTGQSVEDLLGTAAPFPSDAPGVTTAPFDDGEFAGQEFTFENLPLEQFNSGGTGITGVTGPGDQLNITREGDTYVVTGVLDMSGGLSGVTGPFGGTGGAQLLESAEIRLAFTFPGEVIEASGGQVEGNTVTYTPRFGERLEIEATGSAIDNGQAGDVVGGDDGSNLVLILVIAGVVVVALVILFLVLRGRRGGGGGGDTGFGEAAPAATPEIATPPPGASPMPPPAPAPPMPPAAPPPPPSEG